MNRRNTHTYLVMKCSLSICFFYVAFIANVDGAEQELDRRIVKLLGGEDGLNVIRAAERIEAYRIKPEFGPGKDVKKIAGFPIISGPHKVDAGHARVLRRILFDVKTFRFNEAKACEFSPGVVIRFADESETIDILFCFSCDELRIYLDNKRVGHEDFDRARGVLVTLMKQVFPDDAAIQELKVGKR